MKKLDYLLLILLLIFLFSCKKTNEVKSSKNLAGSYIGNVNVLINNTPINILMNHVITINYNNTTSLNINTELIQSESATISGNLMTISRHTVNSTGFFYTVEYGTGTFSNNELTIDFHQDILDLSTNNVYGTGEWTGTLKKQ